MTVPVIDLGDLVVQIVSDGRFALDGGAIFGVVPRALWSRSLPADRANRVPLALNCLLVSGHGRHVLIDTGLGEKGDERFRQRHDVRRCGGVVEALARLGIDPGDVTDVVNTHLHWDHAGGNTFPARGEPPGPTFPRASYHVQEQELAFARRAGERTRGSYRAEDFEPLVSQGRLVLLDGRTDIAPGITVHLAPGHLPHMQVVTVTGRNGTVFFPADLVPTTHHLAPAWIMAYDVEPLRTLETKKEWLDRAARGEWRVVFYHDVDCPVATVEEREGRWLAHPLQEN